jgi:ribosomal protein L29
MGRNKMNQETNTVEFKIFNSDLKKMTDAELEASLRKLREMTHSTQQVEKPQATFRRRAA